MGVTGDSYFGLPLKSQTVSLTADNQVITLTDERLILLSSDNTTATNRTFTLVASSIVGNLVTIIFTSAGATTAEFADTSIQKLSAAWTPQQYDTLTLISDGTNWIEVARSDN